ncbi:MAG: hypothetical protein RJB09_1626 [Pseudomonadota bacterium]
MVRTKASARSLPLAFRQVLKKATTQLRQSKRELREDRAEQSATTASGRMAARCPRLRLSKLRAGV